METKFREMLETFQSLQTEVSKGSEISSFRFMQLLNIIEFLLISSNLKLTASLVGHKKFEEIIGIHIVREDELSSQMKDMLDKDLPSVSSVREEVDKMPYEPFGVPDVKYDQELFK